MRKFLFLVSFILLPTTAFACPGCDDLLNRGREALGFFKFSQGIAWSILLMLTVLFGMIGAFVFVIWRSTRSKNSEVSHEGKD